MQRERRGTCLHVDELLCIGCGICVEVCPMRILDLQDSVCVLLDGLKCLECGGCMRACPNNALSIEEKNSKEDSPLVAHPVEKREGKIRFSPLLEELNELLMELSPVQVYECGGADISEFDNFEIEGEQCSARLYKAEKVEKMGIANINFFGLINTSVITIRPAPEYDIPLYSLDWGESEGHTFIYCDLVPSDDPGRNLTYLTKYLYNSLEDLYQKYSTVPGLKSNVFHWVRAISSPYHITGTIMNKSQKSFNMIHNCARDYLKAWIALWKEAQPQDPHSDYMRLVHERRKTIGKLLMENDPGLGPLNKFLGDKKARIAMSIVEP